MSYKVLKETNKFQVVEKDTELKVYASKKESISRSLCRSLNLGSGFNGFTPYFFTIEYK